MFYDVFGSYYFRSFLEMRKKSDTLKLTFHILIEVNLQLQAAMIHKDLDSI